MIIYDITTIEGHKKFVESLVKLLNDYHEERMKNDPAYKIAQKAFAEEYDRVFNVNNGN